MQQLLILCYLLQCLCTSTIKKLYKQIGGAFLKIGQHLAQAKEYRVSYLTQGMLACQPIFRVRPIRVKWPMFDVPIFRRKNSDSDGRCLVGTVTSVDVDKSRAQAYASIPASYIANYIYCTIANF